MMTAEQLKNSILQLAMQGKLVEQRPEEGTGENLYKEIKAEKKELIKEGKIKAGKKYDPVSEEEITFDIPETWTWVRLSDVVFNRGQKKPANAFSYIDIGSIDNVHQKLNDEENIVEPENAPSRARKIVARGDIIYSTVRPYLHNMCVIDREFSHEPIASTGFAAMTCHKGLYNKYLFYYLLSPDFDKYANDTENSKGVAYPAINDQKLYKALVPLPPLVEQKRIVAKIEELMPFVEQYAAASTKLNTLNATFPEMMKKSILQEAVQGKLVPQDPNDEPASLLLKKIAEEKKHVKEKRNKSNKNNATPLEIKDDEKIFDVPESWMWVRAGWLFDYVNGVAFKSGDYIDSSDVLNCRMSNIRPNGYFDPEYRKTYLPNDFYEKYSEFRVFDGDILVALTDMATEHPKILGLPTIVHTNGHKMLLNQRVLKIMPYLEEITEYLNCILQYMCVIHFRSKLKGGGSVQINLKTKDITELAIPLPPLAEQIRIVKKAKELIQLTDKMTQ